jgi:large conductance mechanosensitive channel
MRGSVLDLAIGIIIGSAFGTIISSLVNDIIMPPIGLLFGKVNFNDLYINLSGQPAISLADAQVKGLATINYGLFLNHVISFLILAVVIFFVVKGINKLAKKPAPPAAPTTKECPHCFTTISIKANRCPNCTSQL